MKAPIPSVADQAKSQFWRDADGRCQDCSAEHNSYGYHDPQGRFYEIDYHAHPGASFLVGGFVHLRVIGLDSAASNVSSPLYRLLCHVCEGRRRAYSQRADRNRPLPGRSDWLRVTHSYSRECIT